MPVPVENRSCRLVHVQIKENIRVSRHWPLLGESTGDGWIPLIKGQ